MNYRGVESIRIDILANFKKVPFVIFPSKPGFQKGRDKMKYHINAKGDVKKCLAIVRRCPYGEEAHFPTRELAEKSIQEKLERDYGIIPKSDLPLTHSELAKNIHKRWEEKTRKAKYVGVLFGDDDYYTVRSNPNKFASNNYKTFKLSEMENFTEDDFANKEIVIFVDRLR